MVSTDRRGTRSTALILLAGMLGLGWLGLRAERTPAVAGGDAPEAAFSAVRAREHLREIARQPHPVGSAAHADVRDYLKASLVALDAEVEVQHTLAWSPYRTNYGAEVFNVLGRFRGTASTGAVLLLAHYDSVMGSYGASDDGAGVSAILEAVRALRTGGSLRNDLIVLISDAEEVGLLGAAAFVEQHPWFADVAIVLNVEARGSHGPSYMFQTTGPNGTLIRGLAGATPRPVANTVMQEVYERLPNGTDLSVFMDTGVAGMDFAYIRGLSHYHTPLDSLETQDPASLQHHGSYLLGLAREFGAADLAAAPGGDLVYFNAGSIAFVRYPASWVKPIAVIALLAVLVVVGRGLVRRELRASRAILGLVAIAVSVSAAWFVAQSGWNWLATNMESPAWDSYRLFYDSTPYVLAFGALTVALVGAAVNLALRWATSAEIAALPMLLVGGLGALLAWVAPGGSYLMAWPALAGACALGLLLERDEVNAGSTAALTLLGAPILLLTFPWVVWLEIAMTLSFVGGSVALLGLVLAALAPQLAAVHRSLGWRVPLAFSFVAAAAWYSGITAIEYDDVKKRPVQVSYFADLDQGAAYWYSLDPEITPWATNWLSDAERRDLAELGLGAGIGWVQEAPLDVGVPPTFETVADEVADGRRTLDLTLRVAAGTHQTVVEIPASVPAPARVWVEGRLLDSADGEGVRRLVGLVGAPAQGFAVRIEADPDDPVALRLRAVVPGIPLAVPQPPSDTMPRNLITVVQATHTQPPRGS